MHHMARMLQGPEGTFKQGWEMMGLKLHRQNSSIYLYYIKCRACVQNRTRRFRWTNAVQIFLWRVSSQFFNILSRLGICGPVANPEKWSSSAIDPFAGSCWPILNNRRHTARDRDQWKRFIEHDINRNSDACPTTGMRFLVEQLIRLSRSDQVSPDSVVNMTRSKLHKAKEHVPPIWEATDDSEM